MRLRLEMKKYSLNPLIIREELQLAFDIGAIYKTGVLIP